LKRRPSLDYLDPFLEDYALVLAEKKDSTAPLTKILKGLGIGYSTFKGYRHLVELRLIDQEKFSIHLETVKASPKPSCRTLNEIARMALACPSMEETLQRFKQDGHIL